MDSELLQRQIQQSNVRNWADKPQSQRAGRGVNPVSPTVVANVLNAPMTSTLVQKEGAVAAGKVFSDKKGSAVLPDAERSIPIVGGDSVHTYYLKRGSVEYVRPAGATMLNSAGSAMTLNKDLGPGGARSPIAKVNAKNHEFASAMRRAEFDNPKVGAMPGFKLRLSANPSPGQAEKADQSRPLTLSPSQGASTAGRAASPTTRPRGGSLKTDGLAQSSYGLEQDSPGVDASDDQTAKTGKVKAAGT